MKGIKSILKKNWILLVGAFLGAIGGYFYWLYVGCNSGSCPITSSPTISSFYGALMGGLLGSMFKTESQK